MHIDQLIHLANKHFFNQKNAIMNQVLLDQKLGELYRWRAIRHRRGFIKILKNALRE
jgi:hypothetical protein